MLVDSLDTSVILAFILGSSPEQRDIVWNFLNDPDYIHRIPDMVIAEAVYILEDHYGLTRAQIIKNLRKFLGEYDDVLDYNHELFDLVFPFYARHPSLSFSECCMASYAELCPAEPLFTFDAKLARQHPSAKKLS